MGNKAKTFTIMLVPDRAGTPKRYRIAKAWVKAAGTAFGLFVLVLSGAGYHYYTVVDTAAEARALREENLGLRSELRLVEEKVSHFTASLERVERMDAKLRMLTQVSDPERNLAIGPVSGSEKAPLDTDGPLVETENSGIRLPLDKVATDEDIELLHARLENLAADARREEASLAELQEYFEDQKTLLAAMPSIWPARGWVTSAFGTRADPFTGDRSMHKGLDVAAEHGTRVRAPADGTVVFSGVHGAYGNVVVIDHGFGVNTRFGHLSEVFAKVGDTLTRGQVFSAIGNTGRSTGPHLHYEVRVNGIPQDPRKFILD
ncbi:MAG: M23 family metallopeptidase [Deltaproteobacteria bacterium]|nr:M23 family metallopeptidase [Deltaproteobacteria bacterium]